MLCVGTVSGVPPAGWLLSPCVRQRTPHAFVPTSLAAVPSLVPVQRPSPVLYTPATIPQPTTHRRAVSAPRFAFSFRPSLSLSLPLTLPSASLLPRLPRPRWRAPLRRRRRRRHQRRTCSHSQILPIAFPQEKLKTRPLSATLLYDICSGYELSSAGV